MFVLSFLLFTRENTGRSNSTNKFEEEKTKLSKQKQTYVCSSVVPLQGISNLTLLLLLLLISPCHLYPYTPIPLYPYTSYIPLLPDRTESPSQGQPQERFSDYTEYSELSHIQSLEAQVAAMHDAFRVQERTLAMTMTPDAMYPLSQQTHHPSIISYKNALAGFSCSGSSSSKTADGDDHKAISDIPPSDRRTDIPPSTEERSHELATMERFPYYRMLTQWRSKAVECMVSQRFQDRRIESLQREAKVGGVCL